MSEVMRYRDPNGNCLEENSEGAWVLYSDHLASVKALEAEVEEHRELFALQRTRMGPLEAAWQKAHPEKPDTYPDLGALCEWAASELERLNRLRVHCPDCGGDYAATGLEVGCSCKLRARLAALEKALRKVLGHTAYPAWSEFGFLAGLLASIDRIARAALGAKPEEEEKP